MNVKRASAIISLILVVILIGFVIVDIGPENQNPVNNSSNGTDNETPMNNNTDDEGKLSRLPTGLTLASGTIIIDESSLIESHNRRLSNNSVKVRIQESSGTKNIAKEGQNIIVNDSNFIRDRSQFSNGDYTLERTNLTGSNKTTYSANVSTIPRNQYTFSSKISTMLSNLNVTDYEVRNDSVYVQLESNQTSGNIALSYGLTSVDNARMDIVVDESGYIRSAEISVSGTLSGGIPTVKQESYKVEKLGGTEVNRPSWASEAESRTSLVSGVLNSERNYIKLNHRGLEPLNSSDSIKIVEFNGSDISSSTIELNRTIAQGSVVYLSPRQSGAWEITYGNRPEEDGGRELRSTIVVSGGSTSENTNPKFEIEFEQ